MVPASILLVFYCFPILRLCGLCRIQLFDCRADVIFQLQLLVHGGVVGWEVGDGDVHLSEQFGGLGEFVAVHIRLAVGPGPFVRGEGVVFCLFGVAESEPELGKEAMRGVAELSQAFGFLAGIGERVEMVLGQGKAGLGAGINNRAGIASQAQR